MRPSASQQKWARSEDISVYFSPHTIDFPVNLWARCTVIVLAGQTSTVSLVGSSTLCCSETDTSDAAVAGARSPNLSRNVPDARGQDSRQLEVSLLISDTWNVPRLAMATQCEMLTFTRHSCYISRPHVLYCNVNATRVNSGPQSTSACANDAKRSFGRV